MGGGVVNRTDWHERFTTYFERHRFLSGALSAGFLALVVLIAGISQGRPAGQILLWAAVLGLIAGIVGVFFGRLQRSLRKQYYRDGT
jgi:uncharacterized membrane protein